jgi:hypothetical protein
MVLLHYQIGLNLYVNPEMFICKRASEDYYLISKVNALNRSGQAGWHLYSFPKGKSPKFPHGWLRISKSPRYPHYDLGGLLVVGWMGNQVFSLWGRNAWMLDLI